MTRNQFIDLTNQYYRYLQWKSQDPLSRAHVDFAMWFRHYGIDVVMHD